jgi:hypothetical protein
VAFAPGPVLWATLEGAGIVRLVPGPTGIWNSDPAESVLASPLRDPSVLAGDGLDLVLVAGRDDGSALTAWTSGDGVEWSPLSGDGVFLEPSEEWESGWVGRPSIVSKEDEWIVAWEGGPGRGIGLGRLDATGACERLGSEPSLDPGRAGSDPWWESVASVGSPFLFVQDCDPGWTGTGLLFEGVGLERINLDVHGAEPSEVNSSVGYARLEGGALTPDPFNPLYTTMAGLAVTRSEHAPAIVCSSGVWNLYYEASDPGSGLSEGLFSALPY